MCYRPSKACMPIFGHTFLAITQIFSGKFGLHFAGKLRGLFIIYGLFTVNQGHYAYLPISIVTTCRQNLAH